MDPETNSGRYWNNLCFFVIKTGIIFSYYPYYSAYSNFLFDPLARGHLRTSTAFILGWSEGLDEAAKWLNQRENPQDLIVASWFCNVVGVFLMVV